MKDIWAYDPDICDGGPCPLDCTYCPKRELVEEKEAENDE